MSSRDEGLAAFLQLLREREAAAGVADDVRYIGYPRGSVVRIGGRFGVLQVALPTRLDLRRHSGVFEWGVRGRGALQLALALAADVLQDDQRELRTYEALHDLVVVGLPTAPISVRRWDCWTLRAGDLRRILERIESGALQIPERQDTDRRCPV